MAKSNKHQEQLKRRMKIMLIALTILFGLIFLYKTAISLLISWGMSRQSQVVPVSTMKVQVSVWDSELKAVGSLRAIKGVSVTTELAGAVKNIFFTPGTMANKGDILVELNIDADVAQLHALQANAELANIIYNRNKKQVAIQAISKETLETSASDLKNKKALVAEQAAIVAKKIIQAPFTGRLGISVVNPGQYVNPGDKIVTLQQLDPIYADFTIPQQYVSQLRFGQAVRITSDSYPQQTFTGKVTTIDPLVDPATRNVQVEATIDNPKLLLLPGMFANVTVTTNNPQRFVTVPQSAITYNPYGDVVYIVNRTTDKEHKNPYVQQVFVQTGEMRGDQVAILKGLKAGDEIVTSGQIKLKNNSEIEVNNSIVPENNPAPDLPSDY